MLEWVPIIGSIVKAVGALRKEAKDIGTDVNEQIDKKVGGDALLDLASLRFESAGMKAIVDKTKNGSASSDDFVRLSELLTSSVDDVTNIFAQLAYDRNYGKYLLVHSGLDVAGQFDDKVKALKTEIRQRLEKLRVMDPRKKGAILEAGEISKLIDDFNTDLVRLHGIAFGPRKASRSKPKPTKVGRKQTTTSGKK